MEIRISLKWKNCINLEAGGDGGKFIVCSFRVSNQIIPAGEHFPAEIKAVIISNTTLICITGHSENKYCHNN